MFHIKDLINLTFCCQQATVITDFSDLEQIGKSHIMTLNGGAMPMDQYQAVKPHPLFQAVHRSRCVSEHRAAK